MSELKIIKISKIISQIDRISYDLFSKRLSETEQKVLRHQKKQKILK